MPVGDQTQKYDRHYGEEGYQDPGAHGVSAFRSVVLIAALRKTNYRHGRGRDAVAVVTRSRTRHGDVRRLDWPS